MQDLRYFDTRFSYQNARTKLWPVLARYLQQRFIPENSVVLDLGAAYCDFINNVRGRERHAVDVAPILFEYAARDVVSHLCSSTDLKELTDSHFDVVFASNLFEHLDRGDFLKTLQEIKRVLKPSGKLIVLQPNFRFCYRTYFDDYTHAQIFTDRSLVDILSSHGFSPEVVIPKFLPFSIRTSFVVHPWLLWLYLRLPLRPLAGQMLVVARHSGS